MARKTKKEKLTAEQRRATQVRTEFTTLPTFQTAQLYIYPVHLIKKDLTKTLLLSILAISLELALFLILEKGLALPFK